MIKVSLSGKYDLMYQGLIAKEQDFTLVVDQKIAIFRKNPQDTRLDNHLLKKRLKGKWAFSVTDDIRIIYKWCGKNSVRFLGIGPHALVYGKGFIN